MLTNKTWKKTIFSHEQVLSQTISPKKWVNCNKSEFASKQPEYIIQEVYAKQDCHRSIEATIM